MVLQLQDNWTLYEETLDTTAEQYIIVPTHPEKGYTVSLPCDIHMPLIAAGVIPEPLEKIQTVDCLWMEKRSWWFLNRFTLDEPFLEADQILLSMELLDHRADIFLNDNALGHHRNTFRAFTADVLPYLKKGENKLLVRLTHGLDDVDEKEIHFMENYVPKEQVTENMQPRNDWRRLGMRKPQYAYGWDWGPRVATCGIGGPVTLQSEKLLHIIGVQAETVCIEKVNQEPGPSVQKSDAMDIVKTQDIVANNVAFKKDTPKESDRYNATLRFTFELDQLLPLSTCEATFEVTLLDKGQQVAVLAHTEALRSGWNKCVFTITLQDARLWWPNDMGEPHQYDVTASVAVALPQVVRGSKYTATKVSYPPFKMGVRTVQLDTSVLPGRYGERNFTLIVNGHATFCKGGNWIPSDSIYMRVSDEKYRYLIEEAAHSHYNMLRIWGGGFYERSVFYETCNANGILVWQDLMFACAAYPDHLDWYREEVRIEVEFQARRLRNHACLVLWSGNNEIHQGFDGWWPNPEALFPYGGLQLWNHILPRLLQELTPQIPYWNSSPYGGLHPTDEENGDVHHWGPCMMSPVMENRITPTEFDKVTAKFVSEYGYIGPCKESSIQKYHGDAAVERGSLIWEEHNNTFEKETVLAGIRKHYRDPENLTFEEYLLYAGLCQGLMLNYSLEALRAKPNCSGAVYWMYNDTWGETGWTTIDYYMNRKVSHPFVKRAFLPKKLIVRPTPNMKNSYTVSGMNETNEPLTTKVAYGYVSFDNIVQDLAEKTISLIAYSKADLFTFTVSEVTMSKMIDKNGAVQGLIVVKPTEMKTSGLIPATVAAGEFRKWQLSESTVQMVWNVNDAQRFLVTSDMYAHAVHFGFDEKVLLSDEYFDLLPGETREIVIESGYEYIKEFPAVAKMVHSF